MEGLHPNLIRLAELGLLYSPYDFAVVQGLRSEEEQAADVAKGVSWTLHSKHLKQADGFAHAFDIEAVGDLTHDGVVDFHDKARTWDRAIYREIAAALKRAAFQLHIQIRCGVDFGEDHFDGPHFELVTT